MSPTSVLHTDAPIVDHRMISCGEGKPISSTIYKADGVYHLAMVLHVPQVYCVSHNLEAMMMGLNAFAMGLDRFDPMRAIEIYLSPIDERAHPDLKRPDPRIVVTVEGGVVSGVFAGSEDVRNVQVAIVDYDTDVDHSAPFNVKFLNGNTEEAKVYLEEIARSELDIGDLFARLQAPGNNLSM